MSESEIGPPLWSWVVSLLLVAGAAMAVWQWARPYNCVAYLDRELTELQSAQSWRAEKGGALIAVLGNSLLYHAVRPPFVQRLLKPSFSAQVLQMSAARVSLTDIPSLLDAVVTAAPYAVVIQQSLLLTDHTAEHRRTTLRRWLGTGQFLRLVETPPWVPPAWGLDCPKGAIEPRRARQLWSRYYANRAMWERSERGRSARAGRAFIERLLTAGSRVLLVAPPRSAAVEELAGAAEKDTWAAFAQTLPPGVETYEPDAPLYEGAHCDLTHLNPAGGRRFSVWLARLLREGEDGPRRTP